MMAAPHTSTSRVSTATVFRAQLALSLDYMRMRRSLIAGAIVLFLTALVSFGDGIPAIRISNTDDIGSGADPQVSIMFVGLIFEEVAGGVIGLCTAFFIAAVYGFVSPFRVWRDAAVSRRAYHRVMPVKRWQHDLIKVMAGALPTLLMVGAIALVTIIGLVSGGYASALST